MKKYFMVLAIMIISSSAVADRLVRLYDVSRGSAMNLIENGYDVTNVDVRGGYVDIMLQECIPPGFLIPLETATAGDLRL